VGEIIGKLIDWVKSPKQTFIVFIATLALISLPHAWVNHLGLQPFERYRGWAVIVCLLFGAAVATQVSMSGWEWVRNIRLRRIAIKTRGQYLHSLTPGEKYILLAYLDRNTATLYLDLGDGVVGALLSKELIYQSSPVGEITTFPFNIQPWVREYLTQHPELLTGAQPPLRKSSAW